MSLRSLAIALAAAVGLASLEAQVPYLDPAAA